MRIDLEALRRELASRTPVDVSAPEIRRRAAVAAVLRDGGPLGPELLFIRRAERPGDPWSGQMAFPGGRAEPDDPDLAATAVRETAEELGVSLTACAELLGRGDEQRTHTGDTAVRPYVWVLREPVVFAPNAEVDEVHWADLASIASGARDTHFDWSRGAARMRFPGFRVGERVVWGLTHRILTELLASARRG